MRLLVVGQQTNGWWTEEDNYRGGPELVLSRSLDYYARFRVGADYYSSPFWVVARGLQKTLNPRGAPDAFLWTNLRKVDEDKGPPPEDVELALLDRFDVLRQEIALAGPDVVVFLTGPDLDALLARQLPGVDMRPAGGRRVREFARLVHPDLPARAFRTYHPNHLWKAGHAKKQAILDCLSKVLAEDCGAAEVGDRGQ